MSASDLERLWEHPAIAVKHVITMSREMAGGVVVCVATCRCGWCFTAPLEPVGPHLRDAALHMQWRDVIAKAEASAP